MTAPDADTHRYTGTGLVRADGTHLAPGETCTPTEAELRAFGDSFTELSPDEMPTATAADPDPDTDTDTDTDGDDEPLLSQSEAKTIISDAGFDPEDYNALSSLAGDMPDVNGNLPADELRVALAQALSRDTE